MKHLALLAFPALALASPALSADLYYRDSGVYDAPPPVVERERIVERRYYAPPPPVVRERIIVEAPPVYYAPRAYYPERYVTYGYSRPAYWGPRWHRPHRW